MRFDDETRTRVYVDVTVTMDPATATVEIEVDGSWHAATWVSVATHHDPMGHLPERWTRRARTNEYFAGPAFASPPGGTQVLTSGRHETQVRVVIGSDTIVGPASVIDVDD